MAAAAPSVCPKQLEKLRPAVGGGGARPAGLGLCVQAAGQGEGFRATVRSGRWGWEARQPPLPRPGPRGSGRGFEVTGDPAGTAGPVCIQSPAVPSALSPNAVNGFSQLLNRQLPPVLAASRSSRGARPRQPAGRPALRAPASLLAAGACRLRFPSCLWGRPPGTEPARLSASLAAFHPRGQPPNGATDLLWVWSLPTGAPGWPCLGGAPACTADPRPRRWPEGSEGVMAFARLQL